MYNHRFTGSIESFVDKILAANASTSSAQHPHAETQVFEKEIDEIVYKLYNLTEEEIKIIERGK